jgi:hypothetical protein
MTHRKHNRPMRDPIDIWDDLLHDAAEQAAADSERTEDDMVWARHVESTVMAGLTGLRRRRMTISVPKLRGVKIPPDIQAMTRNALLVKLDRLHQEGKVQYSFRKLIGFSDDDLRNLLTAALRPL